VLDGSYGTVDQNNQLNGALIVLEIVSLNDTTLELKNLRSYSSSQMDQPMEKLSN